MVLVWIVLTGDAPIGSMPESCQADREDDPSIFGKCRGKKESQW